MNRRITLINTRRSRDWALSENAPSRIVFGSFFKVIRHTLKGELRELGEDIERVIIDRTATPAEFLELLANVAENFAGDLIFIREAETSYMSAVGRGGGRVLYSMRPEDVRFYLATHGLTATTSVAAA